MIKAIYKITNLINNKTYIGQSVHPNKRWIEHNQKANNQSDNYPIHLAIHKYGKENFSFKILEWTEDYDNREKELINYYNSLVPNGYNIIEGGHSPIMYGEENPRNTISEKDVNLIILALQENKKTDKEIAKEYNTTDKIISDINHGRAHRKDNIKYPIRVKKGRQYLSEQQANEIKDLLLNSKLTFSEIAEKYSTTKINISQINNGRSFKRENTNYPIRNKPVKVNQYES